MKIGIDIDNVITNTTECVVNYVNEKLPSVNLRLEDITTYYIENRLPPEYRWIVPMAFQDKQMWKKVKLIEGAKENIKKLYEEGNEIYFVTATAAENFRKKISFLTKQFDFLPRGYVQENAISIRKKQLLSLDILIDDCADNLIGERTYHSICLEYPWNSSTPDVFSAKNWNDIYNIYNNLLMLED